MNFVAELGDKTQLVTLTFATRYRSIVVLGGIAAGTAASQAVSAILGGLVANILPDELVRILAGLAFLTFGIWTLRGDDEGEGGPSSKRALSPFWLIASTFFLAELGDKTMLGNITLSASYSPVLVFLGGTTGMVLSDGLAIVVGNRLGERLPKRALKVGASLMFFAFGALSLVQGALCLHPQAWIGAGLVIGCFAYAGYLAIRRPDPVLSEVVSTYEDRDGRRR